jgi:hypothetical protein
MAAAQPDVIGIESATLADGTLAQFRVYTDRDVVFTGYMGAVYSLETLTELAEQDRSLALELGAAKILSPLALTDVVVLAHQLLAEAMS